MTVANDPLYLRRGVHERLTNVHSLPFAYRTIEKLDIPYIMVRGRAFYRQSDIDAWARRKIEEAPRCLAESEKRHWGRSKTSRMLSEAPTRRTGTTVTA